MWEPYKKGFKAYLQLEKSLAPNSVESYLRDIGRLTDFLQENKLLKSPEEITLNDLQHYLKWIGGLGMNAASQVNADTTAAHPSS